MLINTLEQFRKERASRTKDDLNPFKSKKTKLPSVPVSIWKNMKGGWLTKDLFYELYTGDNLRLGIRKENRKDERQGELVSAVALVEEQRLLCPYSLTDEDLVIEWKDKQYIITSLKRLYIMYDHLPGYEYEFSKEHLGGWEHWCTLRESHLFKEHAIAWEKEKLIQIKSASMNRILNSAKEGGFNENKFLATKGYNVDNSPKVNKQVNNEISREVNKDMERLGLKLVK